jgi:hypothetical protein
MVLRALVWWLVSSMMGRLHSAQSVVAVLALMRVRLVGVGWVYICALWDIFMVF